MLFEFASDPHIIFNDDGIVDCNSATLEVLEVNSKDDLLGKVPSEFSPEYQGDNWLSLDKSQAMKKIAEEEGGHRFEWSHQSTSGKIIPMDVALKPITLNGEPYLLAVWHDLTERKQVEKTLIEAKRRAEELAESKQQFLSSMSHEIRTPLNAVIGYAHLLIDRDPRSDQLEDLNTLKMSANNLLNLVNDILDLSKIESGTIELDEGKFELNKIVDNVIRIFKIKASEKNLDFSFNIDENVPQFLKGDQVILNQILTNVVGNAIKFTEKGSVSLAVKLDGMLKRAAVLKFEISDTGIGISKDRQAMIFQSFSQAEKSILNEFGGTGLGLAITKSLVELHGGSISIESKIGEGSTFSIEIPFEPVEDFEEAQLQADSLKGMRELLVEDNLVNQKIAIMFLEREEIQVVMALNGKLGLDVLESDDAIDLVLMDLNMPVMDGFEATKAIRSHDVEHIMQVPIIALTADAFKETRDKVFEFGMNGYLTKPIDPEKFQEELAKHYVPLRG